MSNYAILKDGTWVLEHRPRWFDDAGEPVTDGVLADNGYYPVERAYPEYDAEQAYLIQDAPAQWELINGRVIIGYTVGQYDPQEVLLRRRLRRQDERTSPGALASALEVVGRLLVAPHLDTLMSSDLARVAVLFADWEPGQDYRAGEVLNFGGVVIEVVQPHTSQVTWQPDETPALYKLYREAGSVTVWQQPQGGHDSYAVGDRVLHQGQEWVSTVDNNVWEPGVYGWNPA